MLQFGFGISSWGNLLDTFAVILNWSSESKSTWNIGITTITNAGAMVGALCSGSVVKYGKLKMILILNVILIVSIGACMIENIYVIATGRFFWGLCAGSFSVVCPKYLSEFVPIEVRGTLGGIPQFMVCVGIAIPALLSLALEDDPSTASKDDFFVTDYWRVIWATPAVIAIIHTLLLLTCFRFETPFDLKNLNKDDDLLVLMKRCYKVNEVKLRITQIPGCGEENATNQEDVSYWETISDPAIRKSAWVGFVLAMLQQWTGINAIIFYSSQLFDGLTTITPNQGSAILMVWNVISVLIVMAMSSHFGRRTLMLWSEGLIAICMFVMWILKSKDYETYALIATAVFIFLFEVGTGSIVFPYIAEVCSNKGAAVAMINLWFWTLIVGLLTPPMFNDWLQDGKTFIVFGVLSALGFLYVLIYMKETKGKTEAEVKRLYRKNANVSEFPSVSQIISLFQLIKGMY